MPGIKGRALHKFTPTIVTPRSGSITINFNVEGKQLWEIEGHLSASEAVYLLESVKLEILGEINNG